MYTNSASRGQSRPRASAHRSAELSSRRPDSYARGARTRHAMRHGRRDWHNRQRPTREQTRQAAPTATPNDTVGRKRIRTLLHKVTYQSDGKSRNIFSKRIKTNVPFLIIMDLSAKTRAKCATDGRSRHTATAHRRTDTPVRTALRRGRDLPETGSPFTLFNPLFTALKYSRNYFNFLLGHSKRKA